jgi:hypothetical protein
MAYSAFLLPLCLSAALLNLCLSAALPLPTLLCPGLSRRIQRIPRISSRAIAGFSMASFASSTGMKGDSSFSRDDVRAIAQHAVPCFSAQLAQVASEAIYRQVQLGKKLLLVGESSHGTHEFYTTRAAITQKLIEKKCISAVVLEADAPPVQKLHQVSYPMPLCPCLLPLIPYILSPATYDLRLTTYHLPLTTYHLPLTTYHLPPTTYHLPLTTYHLPLTVRHERHGRHARRGVPALQGPLSCLDVGERGDARLHRLA